MAVTEVTGPRPARVEDTREMKPHNSLWIVEHGVREAGRTSSDIAKFCVNKFVF